MGSKGLRVAVGLTLLVMLAGCAKQPAVAPASVNAPKAPEPAPASQAPAAPKEKTAPSAADFNDISYGHLQAGRWKEAEKAANEALRLEPDNPAALYNAGMAALEQQHHATAIELLVQSSVRQPERYEPYLGLARAFEETGSYALAAYAASQAVRYGQSDPETAKRAASVERMRERNLTSVPEGVLTACTAATAATVTTPERTLCVFAREEGWEASPYDLWTVRPDGMAERFPIGTLNNMWKVPIQPIALPGGAAGYLLEGPAEYDGGIEWRLFIQTAEGMRQAVFVQPRETEQPLTDFVYAAAPPVVQGEFLVIQHRSREQKGHYAQVGYKLDLNTAVATQVTVDPGAPPAPVTATLTLDEAFARVVEVPYVDYHRRLFGTRFILVRMTGPEDRYNISMGESMPERVRFDTHWQVSKTTGAVWQR